MALDTFWISVRSAARLPGTQPIADAPRLDAEAIESALRGATRWLSPAAVAGFDEKDFSFLPDDERDHLAKLVTEFRAAVSGLKATVPATGDVVEKALPLFKGVVQSLEFDRYGDPAAFWIGKLIEHEIEPDRPAALAELRFNTGSDHSGDPAVWIWAFLNDAASENDEVFLENAQKLHEFLDPVARQVAPDRWPYIYVRSLAEQSEPVEAS